MGAIGIGGSSEVVDEYPEISGVTTAREAMKKMPEQDRAKIAEQVEVFRVEKRKFDIEVSKWDDNGNDIIVLAKHMCMIMMEMTDFTRGKGPLQTTMAVINAAKKISEAGTKLDKLARQVADQCPESSTKNDLLAYLQRIALYCHQLSITSRVKADVQNVSGELIVSGLDSATSLIQAAKNLMNAVVLTVKSCYVASTKYPRLAVKGSIGGEKPKPIVVWKMKVSFKFRIALPTCKIAIITILRILVSTLYTYLVGCKDAKKKIFSSASSLQRQCVDKAHHLFNYIFV